MRFPNLLLKVDFGPLAKQLSTAIDDINKLNRRYDARLHFMARVANARKAGKPKGKKKRETPKQRFEREIQAVEAVAVEENRKRLDAEEELQRVCCRLDKALEETDGYRWTSASGVRMHPSEMDEQHLRNTVCYLQRRLTSEFGRVRYLEETRPHVLAFLRMLDECKRREFRV